MEILETIALLLFLALSLAILASHIKIMTVSFCEDEDMKYVVFSLVLIMILTTMSFFSLMFKLVSLIIGD